MFGWLPSIPCFVLYFNPTDWGTTFWPQMFLWPPSLRCPIPWWCPETQGPRDPGSRCAVLIRGTRSQNGDGCNICKHVKKWSNWIVAHIISHRRILFANDLFPLHQDAMYAYMCNDPIPTYKKDVVFFFVPRCFIEAIGAERPVICWGDLPWRRLYKMFLLGT